MDDYRRLRIADLTLRVRLAKTGTMVRLSGEIDASSAAPLQQFLLGIMHQHGPRLLLDLSGISFVDCSALTVLLVARQRATQRNGWIRLTTVSQPVRKLIELTDLQDVLGLPRRTALPMTHCS